MLFWGDTLFVVAAALAFDALIGDPDWLWRRMAHPVVVMGELIHWLDRTLNRDDRTFEQRKTAGIVAVLLHPGVRRHYRLFLEMCVAASLVRNTADRAGIARLNV